MHEHKLFDFKAELAQNSIRGAAAVMGNLDRDNDVIYPGAFKGAIKSFLANGFVAVGHDWYGLPIAMPTSAKEIGNQLIAEAEFHSTPEAQNARIVAAERIGKGLSVGLSIGFASGEVERFEKGSELLKSAEAAGHDMSLFDTTAIKRGQFVRGIKTVDELFEFSVVTVPANPRAVASAAKSIAVEEIVTERDFEQFLRDAGFSRKLACAIASHGFKAGQRDAEAAEVDDADVLDVRARLQRISLSMIGA